MIWFSLHDVRLSTLGALYLAMLFVPNIMWARSRAQPDAGAEESVWLLTFERVGQIATTAAALVAPATAAAGPARIACLVASLSAMTGYEIAWVQYFRGPKRFIDLYKRLWWIPVPLALLPVLGFALLACFELHGVLLSSVIVLGVGHVGIHACHATRKRTLSA